MNLLTPVLLSVQFDWNLFFHETFGPPAQFWNGLAITVGVAVLAQILGVAFGGAAVMASRSWRPLRTLSFLYVLVLRGTPIIVQVFFLYFGANLFLGFTLFPREVGMFGFNVQGAILAGATALAINEGAYMSEIIRAGIDSIDRGQTEAALSIGMTRRQAMRHIVLPQAARTIVPPLGNQFNSMLKGTSLLSFIGVTEIFQHTQITYAANFRPVEGLTSVALWYLALTIGWTLIQIQIEKKLGVADSDGRKHWLSRWWSATFRSKRGKAKGIAFARRSAGRRAS